MLWYPIAKDPSLRVATDAVAGRLFIAREADTGRIVSVPRDVVAYVLQSQCGPDWNEDDAGRVSERLVVAAYKHPGMLAADVVSLAQLSAA